MFYKHSYRAGMARTESELIRALRLKGFAVVVMKAGALERGAVEEAMRKAAKTTMKARVT
jgi:hypothetical protein